MSLIPMFNAVAGATITVGFFTEAGSAWGYDSGGFGSTSGEILDSRTIQELYYAPNITFFQVSGANYPTSTQISVTCNGASATFTASSSTTRFFLSGDVFSLEGTTGQTFNVSVRIV